MAGGSASTTKATGGSDVFRPQPSMTLAPALCSPMLQDWGQALASLPSIIGVQVAAPPAASGGVTSRRAPGPTISLSPTRTCGPVTWMEPVGGSAFEQSG